LKKIIEVVNLKKHFPIKSDILDITSGNVQAVNGINFGIDMGETLGLVGESGSGKSTTGRLILRLLQPTSGKVLLEGRDISRIKDRNFRMIRKDLQVVFQNPYSALDPKMTIRDILAEPLSIYKIVSSLDYDKEVARLLDTVGLSSKDAFKFPHEFSGGQRQRIGIARAIATRPKFIVCDEPVSALDVSVQSQILNLLKQLQAEFKLSYLFIAHGLNVIRHVSNNVAVMYLGKIVEKGSVEDIFKNPQHPYTKALLSSFFAPDPDVHSNRIKLDGEIASAIEIPEGCSFNPRCQLRTDLCTTVEPLPVMLENNHSVCCHMVKKKEQSPVVMNFIIVNSKPTKE
jgi:oligopeptide/dipeptide ABC transporter ATP-binding protein